MIHNYKKYIYAAVFCMVFITVLTGCSKKKEEIIEFDSTYPLALAPDVKWAVVTEPYASFKENCDWNSLTEGHCRKGDIFQVTGNSRDKDNEVWYKFESGWLPQSCLSVYSNRYKALSVSESIKDK